MNATSRRKAGRGECARGITARPGAATLVPHFMQSSAREKSGLVSESKEFDAEGRYVEAQFSTVTVISVYFPSGSSGPHRQESKFRFLARFLPHLKRLAASGREFILCGDINIAHREIDLKNWRSNQKHSGFLPEERAWLSRVFEQHGWVDVFRMLDPRPERYTWWSNFGQAYAKNVGWRIDYQIATPGIAKRARTAEIYMGQRFSDHAPLTIEYSGRL